VEYALVAVLGYLIGSVPVAQMVARAHGVDLLRAGDGNPGAWNALEQLGSRRAAPVFAGDALKGLAGGLLGLALAGVPGAYAGVAGAMLGHAFPVFARFRGGKSVMTFVGGAFAISPVSAAVCLATCLAVTLVGSFRLGARVGVFAFPAVQLAFDPVGRVAATGALMTIIGARFLLGRRGRAASPAGSR
jgi:acyl phosphate:glycerol-3-phosphate acyltransferase